MLSRLPDFIVAGVRKCATTWLHRCLQEHPEIYLPGATKETFFFDRYWHRGPDWYARYFRDCAPEKICGEVSPSYFTHPDAPRRIRSCLPYVKLVFVFRDPVERVISSYQQMRVKNETHLDLADALDAHPELLEEGFYARHFARFREVFGPDALLPLVIEDMQTAGEDGLSGLFAFLGVEKGFRAPSLHSRIHEVRVARSQVLATAAVRTSRLLHRTGWHGAVALAKSVGAERLFLRRSAAAFGPVQQELTARLDALYTGEIDQLSQMLRRDLRHVWRCGGAPPSAKPV